MKYFTYIADQAFKEGENGEALFFLSGPWSRPLVIDAEQKDVTYRRHLWLQCIFLGALIMGQPFLFRVIPEITTAILYFLAYCCSASLIYWVAQRFVFRRELRIYKRLEKRMSLKSFHHQMASKHTSEGLFLGGLVCFIFVLIGVWMMFDDSLDERLIGLICIIIFGGCSLCWWYAWRLKSQIRIEIKKDTIVDSEGAAKKE